MVRYLKALLSFLVLISFLPITTAQAEQIQTPPDLACYRSLAEIEATAANLALQHPELAEWIDIGLSYEGTNPTEQYPGHHLYALKLTNRNNTFLKPALVILSGLHAREVLPVEMVLRFAEQLLREYSGNEQIRWILDEHEVHMILVGNPDGRAEMDRERDPNVIPDLSLSHDWIKNTRPTGPCDPATGETQYGVNLKLNFSGAWKMSTVPAPCADNYEGAFAASEPETAAIEDYLESVFGTTGQSSPGLFLHLGSTLGVYGNLVYMPNTPGEVKGSELYNQFFWLGRKITYPMGTLKTFDGSANAFTGSPVDHVYETYAVPSFEVTLGSPSDGYFPPCSKYTGGLFDEFISNLMRAARLTPDAIGFAEGPEIVNLTQNEAFTVDKNTVNIQAKASSKIYEMPPAEPMNIEKVLIYKNLPPSRGGTPCQILTPAEGAASSEFTFSFSVEKQDIGEDRYYIQPYSIRSDDSLVPGMLTTIQVALYRAIMPLVTR